MCFKVFPIRFLLIMPCGNKKIYINRFAMVLKHQLKKLTEAYSVVNRIDLWNILKKTIQKQQFEINGNIQCVFIFLND